jgi:hypothetical protein
MVHLRYPYVCMLANEETNAIVFACTVSIRVNCGVGPVVHTL